MALLASIPDDSRGEILPTKNASGSILDQLKDVPAEQRTARFVCAITIAEPSGFHRTVEGVIEGVIADAPRGENGFGYDPIFFVPELGKTTAELSPEQKNRISHRGRAANWPPLDYVTGLTGTNR